MVRSYFKGSDGVKRIKVYPSVLQPWIKLYKVVIEKVGIVRSTYNYWIKQINYIDKYKEIKELIKEIFYGLHDRYSHRNSILKLQN